VVHRALKAVTKRFLETLGQSTQNQRPDLIDSGRLQKVCFGNRWSSTVIIAVDADQNLIFAE
jgi:hypothetical protein